VEVSSRDKGGNWLITGGCGFIGAALIRHLLRHDTADYIRALDNLTVGTKEDLAQVCEYTQAASELILDRFQNGLFVKKRPKCILAKVLLMND
jgi:dTDP-D-glucose 4,6-dehydratase